MSQGFGQKWPERDVLRGRGQARPLPTTTDLPFSVAPATSSWWEPGYGPSRLFPAFNKTVPKCSPSPWQPEPPPGRATALVTKLVRVQHFPSVQRPVFCSKSPVLRILRITRSDCNYCRPGSPGAKAGRIRPLDGSGARAMGAWDPTPSTSNKCKNHPSVDTKGQWRYTREQTEGQILLIPTRQNSRWLQRRGQAGFGPSWGARGLVSTGWAVPGPWSQQTSYWGRRRPRAAFSPR